MTTDLMLFCLTLKQRKKFVNYLKVNKLQEGDQVIYSDDLFSKFGVIEDEASDWEEEEGMENAIKKAKTKTKKGERQPKVLRKKSVKVFFKGPQEVYEIKDRTSGVSEVK